MNCPKCGECTLYLPCKVALVLPEERYRCEICDWESEPIGDLVLASPAYRLAALKAQGAEPGWYGPDCTLGKTIRLLSGAVAGVVWRDTFLHIAEARLCGFVEVPHD